MRICSLLVILFLFATGCEKRESKSVVLYTSVDQPIAAKVIAEFEKESGIKVQLVTDSEATKSVGLAERLRAEKSSPRAQVWWGNEPFYTIQLASEGLLLPYESPSAADVPAKLKDARWTGSGVRVRVIVEAAVEMSKPLPGFGQVNGLNDLLKPECRNRIAIARPTAGTTGGHVAALYVLWGEEKANQFFKGLHDNGIKILGGNSVVAESVARATLYWGLTDNDDAALVSTGARMILPDQDGIGTLAIPTTVGLVQDSPEAKKLVDYLASKKTEQQLIDAKFAYASVRDTVKLKRMDINLNEVAKAMPEAIRKATAILEGR